MLGSRRVPPHIEKIEILPGEDVPIAFEKRLPQMSRQRVQRLQIIRVVAIERIIGNGGANEGVIGGIILPRTVHPRRRPLIHPKRLHPGVPDIAGVCRRGHIGSRPRNRAAIAAGEKLPLAQREVRELVNTDKEKFRALVLVDVVFACGIAEASGRAIVPGDHVLRFVVTLIDVARHVPTKISDQRCLELWKGAPQ